MSARRVFSCLAALACVALAPSLARASSGLPSSTGKFMVAGFVSPNEWQFIYGPENAPQEQLTLFKRGSNGTITFKCINDGSEELVLEIAGVAGPVGQVIPVSWSIAGNTSPQPMTVIANPKGRTESILVVKGDPVVGMLATMSRVEPEFKLDVTASVGTRVLKVGLPTPRSEARVAATMCAQWHNHALGLRDAPVISILPSSTHIPTP